MSDLLKKLTLSLLSALIVLFSFAPYFSSTKAQVSGTVTSCKNDSQCNSLQKCQGGICVSNVSGSVGTTPTSGQSNTAAGTWYSQGPFDWYNKVYDQSVSPSNEIFGERYTAAQVQWIMYSIPSVILNLFVSPQVTSCVLTNAGNISSCTEIIKQILSSVPEITPVANGTQPSLISLIFADRQLSGVSYIRHSLAKFSLVPEAKAQSPGFGFSALDPVQSMWRASRDISFGLFVLVAIVFAFMIMFRVKISPQVVISVQSAIPKLIITLILVTFSYAIAGFLIDLMYVVIGIFSVILPRFVTVGNPSVTGFFNLLTGVGVVLGPGGTTVGQQGLGGLLGFSIIYLIGFGLALIILLVQSIPFGLPVAGAVTGLAIASGVGAVVILLIILIAFIVFLWTMIRAWWALIKAFANILLLTIFAPLQITIGAFVPALSFGQWVKSYVASLGVFVGTGVMMVLSLIFLLQAWLRTGIGFTPQFFLSLIGGSLSPLTTNGSPYWPPLLGTGASTDTTVGLLFLGVSFVLFTMIPKVADIIQGFISGKPFAYGSAIGEAIVTPISTAIKVGVTTSKIGQAARSRLTAGETPTPPAPPAPGTINP